MIPIQPLGVRYTNPNWARRPLRSKKRNLSHTLCIDDDDDDDDIVLGVEGTTIYIYILYSVIWRSRGLTGFFFFFGGGGFFICGVLFPFFERTGLDWTGLSETNVMMGRGD